MVRNPDSSRREFLTGQAVQKEIRRLGDEFADGLATGDDTPVAPTARDTVRLGTRAMGCPWCVIMNPGPARQVMAASDAFDVVRDVEQVLTIYRDDSQVAQLNQHAAQHWQDVDEELMCFLLLCRRIFDETNGAFDPSTGSLIRLWKSVRDHGRIPFPVEVEAALADSGMSQVVLDEKSMRVKFEKPGLLLDFASIGKGYGIDRAADHIRREEVGNFLLHGGQSSLFAQGEHQELDGWPVGLKNPLFTDKRYATILLKNCGMSTSGSNVQYFRYEGKRYGHLLDPRTGWPADGLLSVTVTAPTACEADALSTAFYVMGLDAAVQYCEAHPEIGALLIPKSTSSKELNPIILNLPKDRLFIESS